jgi:alkanesulfonate monooxygenase SsuD/methylene tetrahydromethanopterin reductase-like flavin-dependent oxidoreductase (luciferase family)
MGIGIGDTAVRDAVLRPARIGDLARYVEDFRTLAPPVPVLVAAGGPASISRAADYADGLILGQGASSEASSALGEIADAAGDGRRKTPAARWLFMIMNLVPRREDEPQARSDIRETVIGQATGALSGTLEAKGIRENERVAVESFNAAIAQAKGNPNAGLSSEGSEIVEQLAFERFALVGTPERAAERLDEAVRKTGLKRIFLAVISDDPGRVLRLAGERMTPRLQG